MPVQLLIICYRLTLGRGKEPRRIYNFSPRAISI